MGQLQLMIIEHNYVSKRKMRQKAYTTLTPPYFKRDVYVPGDTSINSWLVDVTANRPIAAPCTEKCARLCAPEIMCPNRIDSSSVHSAYLDCGVFNQIEKGLVALPDGATRRSGNFKW
jgi:hypothetical protein